MRAGSNWRHLNGLSLGMMGDPVRCLPKVVHPDVAALKLQYNPSDLVGHAPYRRPAPGVLRSSSRPFERRNADEGSPGLRSEGHGAWVPLGVSRMGSRTDQCPCSGLRIGPGARQQGPGRGGVSAIRPLRTAPSLDAGEGALCFRGRPRLPRASVRLVAPHEHETQLSVVSGHPRW